MPSFCAVVSCNDRYGHSENISFHKFPLKRLDLLKKWEAFIQKQRGEDWHASRWSSLCSRHFREEDFRSFNERKTLKKTAVPSLLSGGTGVRDSNKPRSRKHVKVIETFENTKEKEFKEILAIKETLEDAVGGGVVVTNLQKSNCRLCSSASVPSANFLTNYELYGLLQKCFPTLNIQQEDALPKVLCAPCHNNLEEFGIFVDRVWAAQAELQKKFRSRVVEKAVKIKQEPLVRVKQEVAESGYEMRQDSVGFGGVNEDYDGPIDGGAHEEGDDQKYEFCDFPIISDCDIMEIINLDDPFINIPDDDNTTTVNEEEILQKPVQELVQNYMPTAHELLQSHLLMEEHNYAYIDADEFKEENQTYKTEKSDNEDRIMEYTELMNNIQQQQPPPVSHNIDSSQHQKQHGTLISSENYSLSKAAGIEKRALKPIVTSVSAIQQPLKPSSNGIVVLNESIVKSGGDFQLHACMVCQLKFFSIESLKQHYTHTHGTPMVTVPSGNISQEKIPERTCKMEKDLLENPSENSKKQVDPKNIETLNIELRGCKEKEKIHNFEETKTETTENTLEQISDKNKYHEKNNNEVLNYTLKGAAEKTFKNTAFQKEKLLDIKNQKQKHKISIKYKKFHNVSLNTMASQYHQLKKLYQKLQKKCLNLEQNVEQLQLIPPKKRKSKSANRSTNGLVKVLSSKNSSNINKVKTFASKLSTANPEDKIASKKNEFNCTECSKSFLNSNSLRQHKITHTEERKHICSLCQRTFKRRNGLLQHLKGFHLQVKPFSCPVCKHCYALKCDMLRCKHSTLKSLHTSENRMLKIV